MGFIADISKWQGIIDWNLASKEIDFAILKATGGMKPDPKFAVNAGNCDIDEIPYAVYHYLTANSDNSAIEEAKFFYSYIQEICGKHPHSYVVDVEDGQVPIPTAKEIVRMFVRTLRSLGANRVGLYTGEWKYGQYRLYAEDFDWVWIARYEVPDNGKPVTPPSYPYDLWQYTSHGRIPGINANVDLNKVGRKGLGYFTNPEEEDMPKKNLVRYITMNCIGEDVRMLQKMLNATNKAGLETDGVFGAKTYKAVKDYQRSRKLAVDGIVGHATWNKLLGEM